MYVRFYCFILLLILAALPSSGKRRKSADINKHKKTIDLKGYGIRGGKKRKPTGSTGSEEPVVISYPPVSSGKKRKSTDSAGSEEPVVISYQPVSSGKRKKPNLGSKNHLLYTLDENESFEDFEEIGTESFPLQDNLGDRVEGRYPRLGRYLFWGRDIEEDDCMEMCVKCDVCKDWRGVKEDCVVWNLWKFRRTRACGIYVIRWYQTRRDTIGQLGCVDLEPPTPPPEPEDCLCGIPNRMVKIVGGEETEVNEYPWQGALRGGGRFCGAVLISDEWAISAAHCVEGAGGATFTVTFGEHDLTEAGESEVLTVTVKEIHMHPDYYVNSPLDSDYAMLHLEERIDFSMHSHIRPVCLPENDDNQYENWSAIVSGWGRLRWDPNGRLSDTLQEVTLSVYSNDDCGDLYSNVIDGEGNQVDITDRMICAGVNIDGKGSCQGDSGGPLITREVDNNEGSEENYELIGVVSFGVQCALARYPSVFARVSPVLDWIREKIAGSGMCPRNYEES